MDLRPNQLGGIRVSLSYPAIKKLSDRVDEQESIKRKSEEGIAVCERKAAQLANQDGGPITSLLEASQKRQEIAQQVEVLEKRKQHAEYTIRTIREEFDGRLGDIAYELWHKQQLVKELPTAQEHPPDLAFDRDAPRSRWTIEDELTTCMARLANLTEDPKLRSEFEAFQTEVLARRPYVILKNSYAQMSDGRILTLEELQALAVEHGSSSPLLRGVRSGPYQPGARVPREEAARLGVS